MSRTSPLIPSLHRSASKATPARDDFEIGARNLSGQQQWLGELVLWPADDQVHEANRLALDLRIGPGPGAGGLQIVEQLDARGAVHWCRHEFFEKKREQRFGRRRRSFRASGQREALVRGER